MTVSTTTTKAIYNGDGSTTAFPTTFEFFDDTDIVVTERAVNTGAETTKTLTTDYTVSGGNGATGTVTATTAPPATVQWVIGRKTPLTQQIDYVENDDFPAETHEQGLDRGVMIAQDRQGEIDRALKVPVSDPAAAIGELPNSLTAWTVTLAASGNGLNRRSSRVNPSAVMPPTRCHTFGTDTTHRSPVNSSSVHIVLDTTAGPSSNSTIPGVGPRRASSAVSTLLASGPRSTKGSVSGSNVGLELGRVINASTSTAVPTS